MKPPEKALPWWVNLAWRLRFTKAAWRALVGLTLAIASLSVGLHLSAASLLSTAQMDERDFGRFTQSLSASLGACDPKQCDVETREPKLASASGATSLQMLRTLVGIRVDRVKANAGLLEGRWTDSTFPEAYSLTAGRWPAKTGEVVVPATWQIRTGERLTTYAGAYPLTVVGSAKARFDDKDQTVLAAPGTSSALYAALDAQSRRYRLPESVVTIRTTSANAAALERAVSRDIAEMTSADEAAVLSGIKGTTMVRSREADRWPQFLDRLPVIAGWLPLLLVPTLFSLLAAYTGLGRLGHGVMIASAVGLPMRRVNSAAILLWLAAVLIAAIGGVIGGEVISDLMRPWLRQRTSRPLSPAPDVSWLLGAAMALAAAGVAPLVGMSILHGVRARFVFLNLPSRRWLQAGVRGLGMVLLALTSAAAVGQFVTASLATEREMMRWIVLSCLLLALGVAGVLTAASDRRMRLALPMTLALRRVRASRASSVCIISIVMLAAALPLSAGITMATAEYRSNLTRVSNVPEGQVVLGMNFAESGGLPPRVRASFERYTGLSNPILTRQAKAFTTGGIMQGLPYVMDSVSDVERFIGHPLTAGQIVVFEAGGLLVPDFKGNNIKEGQILNTTTPEGKATGSLKVTLVKDVPESYQIGNLGFVSRKRAEQGGWRTDNGYATYTDVSGPQLSAALRAAKALGFDPRSVATYDVPPAIAIPPALSLAGRLLMGVLALIVLFVTLRYLAEVWPYSRTLQIVGLPTRHIAWTVVTMLALTVAVPLVLGHLVAVWINQIGWRRAIHDNYGAVVPWAEVWTSLGMSLVVALFSALAGVGVSLVRSRRASTL